MHRSEVGCCEGRGKSEIDPELPEGRDLVELADEPTSPLLRVIMGERQEQFAKTTIGEAVFSAKVSPDDKVV